MIASPKLRWCAALATLAFVGAPGAVQAQQTRDELIRGGIRAYDQFETERAIELLQTGIDPNAGPPDSLWAVGVQMFAQILLEEGEGDLAEIWLRWALRVDPEMTVDSVTFLPELVRAYRAARDYVASSEAGSARAETRWHWAPRGVTRGSGTLIIDSPDVAVAVQLSVSEVGAVAPGSPLELTPGSYEIQAEAHGYDPIRVTREVLPGATTQLALRLMPELIALGDSALAPSVATETMNSLARLTAYRFGTEPTCVTGYVADREGLVVTTYRAIRGADSVSVQLPATGSQGGIRVAAYDVGADVAVLKLPQGSESSLTLVSQPSEGEYVWGFGFRDCQNAVATQTRIAAWRSPPRGVLSLGRPVSEADQGGPVTDAAGRVVGLATPGQAAVSAAQIRSALDVARRTLRSGRLSTVGQVAVRERHQFGAVAISTDMSGTVARLTPLESWHWPEAARSDSLPMLFAGPVGRYRLELLAESRVHKQLELRVNPGQRDELFIPLLQVTTDSGGGFPWAIAALGVAGAGGAVALLAGGGGGGDGDTTGPTTGGISIRIPNP